MSLMSLPTELNLHIISYLDPLTAQFLRSANTYFRSLIPPFEEHCRGLEPWVSVYQWKFETEDSEYARRHDLLSCSACERLLPSSRFTKAMIEGFHKDNKNHDPEYSYYPWRFCIQCGSQPLTWDNEGKGDYFKYLFRVRWSVDGVKYGRCPRCEVVKPGEWIEWQRWDKLQMCGTCEPFEPEEDIQFRDKVRRAGRERWRVRGQNKAMGRG